MSDKVTYMATRDAPSDYVVWKLGSIDSIGRVRRIGRQWYAYRPGGRAVGRTFKTRREASESLVGSAT